MTGTWERIANHLTTRYQQARRRNERCLQLALAAGEHRIGITLETAMAYGHVVVVVSADLGPSARLDAWSGLVINARLVHGALAIDGGNLMLRACIPITGATEDVVEGRVRALAAEAIELERQLGARPSPTATFNYYCE